MWQTKYALAVPKILGLGVDFRPCSEGDFLTGRPQSVLLTIKGIQNHKGSITLKESYLPIIRVFLWLRIGKYFNFFLFYVLKDERNFILNTLLSLYFQACVTKISKIVYKELDIGQKKNYGIVGGVSKGTLALLTKILFILLSIQHQGQQGSQKKNKCMKKL